MKTPSAVTPERLLSKIVEKGWFGRRHDLTNKPWRIGVCVSGGPDSMALAYLLRTMSHPLRNGDMAFEPCAFIVDHSARDGSHEEAMQVKSRLETMGIETRVYKLVWPTGVDPKSMQGFEESARVLRYRALAQLASSCCVNDLFTGHHQDDQIETLMFRLLRDKTLNPFSYQGMAISSTVPCSDEKITSSLRSSIWKSPNPFFRVDASARVLRYETYWTGAQLRRPLLEFSKADLIATCDHFKIPYVHDKTNFNPRLTPRNTIRHLRSNHTLPRALQGPALLSLSGQASAITSAIKGKALEFRDHILGFHMHSETGLLVLRLRALPFSMNESQLQGFAFFIQRMAALVSPAPHTSIQSMLDRDLAKQIHACTRVEDVVTASVMVRPVVFTKVLCSVLAHGSLAETFSMSFSRQPFSATEQPLATTSFQVDGGPVDIPATGKAIYSSLTHLWDGRFWIKIQAEEDVIRKTVVRPYRPTDVSRVKASLTRRNLYQIFAKTLSSTAPRNIRFTIPVLVVSDQVVAFPTLNVTVVPDPVIAWEVAYARNQWSSDFLFPGIRNGDVLPMNFEQTAGETRWEDPETRLRNRRKNYLTSE